MTPPRVYVPLAPMVTVRVAAPREILFEKVIAAVALPFPDETPVVTPPIVKFPPIVIPPPYLPLKSKVLAAARVPPLIVKMLAAAPPMELTPPTMTVPLLSVKPPPHAEFPEPSLTMPWPSLMKPVPAELDHPIFAKSRIPPIPTSRVRTFPPVPQEPLPFVKLTTTFGLTVIFPAVVVRLITYELAVKDALFPFVYPVVKGPPLEVPQLESVQFPEVPFVFQYSCPCTAPTEAARIARKLKVLPIFKTGPAIFQTWRAEAPARPWRVAAFSKPVSWDALTVRTPMPPF
jgi:hypothetical protein